MRSPTRRTALAVCIALLLVTAGCSGGTGPSSTATSSDAATTGAATTTTADDAPAPEPEVPASSTGVDTGNGTWSPNVGVEEYPPGVAENGTLANVSALLDAHFAATANASVVFTYGMTGPNQTVSRTYGHGADGRPFYSSRDENTSDGGRVVEETYWNGSRGYSRVYASTRPELGTVHRGFQNVTYLLETYKPGGEAFGRRTDLGTPLHLGNYSVNGTVERGDRTLVELTADDASGDAADSMTDFDGRVLVTPDGVVYEATSSTTQSADDGTEERYAWNVSLQTGVEWTGPPAWMDDIPQLSVSIVEDGRAVELRNTGGAALPANTSLDIFARNDPLHGEVRSGEPRNARSGLRPPERAATVTTDVRLEPGEAVYVTAGADGNASSFALHDEPTSGEYTFGFAGVRSTDGDVGYYLGTGIVSWNTE
ncbi:hypothetical protein ABSL23_13165 [Halobacterium sp. NMX12-1]|uniref:Uncharacterized protein n=1 Tax=Halobacterium sp. NMX12-1 TaxID=3166650 RepID=A0AAU8CD41_9EURY